MYYITNKMILTKTYQKGFKNSHDMIIIQMDWYEKCSPHKYMVFGQFKDRTALKILMNKLAYRYMYIQTSLGYNL